MLYYIINVLIPVTFITNKLLRSVVVRPPPSEQTIISVIICDHDLSIACILLLSLPYVIGITMLLRILGTLEHRWDRVYPHVQWKTVAV